MNKLSRFDKVHFLVIPFLPFQAKKTAKQSKQLNQKAEGISSDGCQPKLSAADEGNPSAVPEDGTPVLTEGQPQQSLSSQRAAVKGEPLEGSSTKAQTRARRASCDFLIGLHWVYSQDLLVYET